MSRVTLRLTLDVTYEVNDETEVQELRNNLLDLNSIAMRNGVYTDGTDAEVVIANPKVEEL